MEYLHRDPLETPFLAALETPTDSQKSQVVPPVGDSVWVSGGVRPGAVRDAWSARSGQLLDDCETLGLPTRLSKITGFEKYRFAPPKLPLQIFRM